MASSRRAAVRWRNWTGDQTCVPAQLSLPRDAAEAAEAVAAAARRGHVVRVAGAGHSFNDGVATDGLLIHTGQMDRVLDVDRDAGTVRAEAGIRLDALARELERNGLALASQGDIERQTLGGAVATATHGTGARHGTLSSQLCAVELALADGSVRELRRDADGDRFRAAQVSVGALGVITAVTLRCAPAFRLRFAEAPAALDAALDSLDAAVDRHDHFELFVFPHTETAIVRTRDRTDEPGGRSRAREIVEDDLVANVGLEALARLGRRVPRAVPALNRVAARTVRPRAYVASSYAAFTSPRRVRFTEMEYAVPRAVARDAIRAVLRVARERRLPLSLPFEIRFVAGDDALLSPAHGGERCYVAVHAYRGTPWEPAFRALEEPLLELGGRPHWGKRHLRDAADLAPRYPEWERYQRIRRELDPADTFANAHVRRVLG